MKLKLISMAALMGALFLAGCATSGTQMNTAHIEQIEKGVTTRADLESAIGKPMSIGFDAEGRKTATWMYVHAKSQARNFIPVVGAFAGGVDSHTQMLMVIFNPDGTVQNFNFNDSDSEMNYGLAQ